MSQLVACPQCGTTQLSTREGLCATCLLKAGLSDSGIFERGVKNPHETCDSLREGAPLQDPDQTQTTAESATEEDSPAADTSELCPDELSLDFLTPSVKPNCLGTLGNYEILEVIGRGGFGIVLKGIDPNLQRLVAIKVIAPDLAADPTARVRFLREARSAAAVNHPNVVEIHEVNEKALLPYLVMEYVDGVTLANRIKQQGPMALEEILRIGAQTAAGLASAHAQGLIHRDIKPANILLPKNVERVKITDFGLARTAEDAHLTRSGALAGTPQYMSPQQADGADLDTRSDLFSLGSTLYFACTGAPPFRGENTVAVLRAVCEEEPAPVNQRNRNLPNWLAEILAKLMAKKPVDRFQSAAEVAELLERHLAHLQNPKKTPRPGSVGPIRSANITLRRWLAAAAVLLVVLGGFALSEATGVTGVVDFAATVLRIRTPDGTLVVKVDDPKIKIEVTGDGDVVITGAGPQDLRLKPGQYQVKATRNGATRIEWITIERGGRKILEVHLEPAVAAKQPDAAPPLAIAPFDGAQATKHQQAWAKYVGVPAETANRIGMKLRLIPPGQFLMRPNYDVKISKPFQIGTYEVTIAQFRAFVDDTGYKTTAEVSGNGQYISRAYGELEQRAEFTWRHKDVYGGDNHPVAQLSWNDAVKFCEWLGRKEGKRYRLPTEAEWEWACRAGSLGNYHFGNDPGQLEDHVWYNDNSKKQTHAVGLKKPNPWGLFDVHGNVCEYCLDWHAEKFPGGQVSDPRGPANGQFRVTRGGGYIDTPESLTLLHRGAFSPSGSLNHFGMRVVCEVAEPVPPPALVKAPVAPADPVKIWSEAPHNAFTDLIRFEDRWYCCFREGIKMGGDPGSIRILVSKDAKSWKSAAVLRTDNVDLRDPHLSITPDKRLMLNSAAVVPATEGQPADHYSWVSFSSNGSDWSKPQRILGSWEWLWRVTWHKGHAYGVAYSWDPKAKPREYTANLYRSKDGITYEKVTRFENRNASEATVAFDGDVMVCLQRRDIGPITALFGRSEAPYTQWNWKDLGVFVGGPNLIQDPKGTWWAAGRLMDGGERTAVCRLDTKAGKLEVVRILTSGKGTYSTGYPGLVWYQDKLWISYYSSHEGQPSIYLATHSNEPLTRNGLSDEEVKRIAALPAAQQIEGVRKELMRRNPGFDGKGWQPTIENGVVTKLKFCTDHVTDISPVRALTHLQTLHINGSNDNGSLSDLAPLKGMKLTRLELYHNKVKDLSPLRGMPLERLGLWWAWFGDDLSPLEGMPLKDLNIGGRLRELDITPLAGLPLDNLCVNWTKVSDLSPLKKMPLTSLKCCNTQVSDLSPVRGMGLKVLLIDASPVTDLSPLKGMPLEELKCDFQAKRDAAILRDIKTLTKINGMPAAKFWKEAGAPGKKAGDEGPQASCGPDRARQISEASAYFTQPCFLLPFA